MSWNGSNTAAVDTYQRRTRIKAEGMGPLIRINDERAAQRVLPRALTVEWVSRRTATHLLIRINGPLAIRNDPVGAYLPRF